MANTPASGAAQNTPFGAKHVRDTEHLRENVAVKSISDIIHNQVSTLDLWKATSPSANRTQLEHFLPYPMSPEGHTFLCHTHFVFLPLDPMLSSGAWTGMVPAQAGKKGHIN